MNAPQPSFPADNEAIETTAALWLARRDAGLSREEEIELARWRQASAAHEAIFNQLIAAWSLLQDGMPRLAAQPNETESAVVSYSVRTGGVAAFRRHWKMITAVAAALTAAAVVGWPRWPSEFTQRYIASVEGPLAVTLPDHSVIELNHKAEVVVRLTPAERKIQLVQGEAHFAVAKDKDRPFVVTAGHTAVRAVGTAFDVRLESGNVTVMVTEGRVQVHRTERPRRLLEARSETPHHLVDAGQQATIPIGDTDNITVRTMDPTQIEAELGWKEPNLLFSETPLAEAIAKFNQYNTVKLVLVDADLGAVALGGSFRADKAEAFVRLLERTKGITIERRGEKEILLHKTQR